MKQAKIERFINNYTSKAISDYKMISNRDKILAGISGTDSLSLLEILQAKQKYAPVKFKLAAVHMALNKENAKVIKNHLEKKNIEHYIINLDLGENKGKNKTHCFWCSWQRRKAIFKLADKLKCNKVAFGHHLDDIIETYLLNIFFMAELSTMPPKLKMIKGNFHIIRPFCYVPKKQIEKYARLKNLPRMPVDCPYAKITNRPVVREFIEEMEKKYPHVKINALKSMANIKKDYLFKKPFKKVKKFHEHI